MGVYIKGMEMPKNDTFNLTLLDDGTVCDGVWGDVVAQAVELPPHGRLIDADKQDAQIEALIERHLHGYTKSTWDFVCELRDILKRNSTIIEAEASDEIL